MPVEYTIDSGRHLVFSVVKPPVTSAEAVQFCRDLSADTRFESSFNQLHVVRSGALALFRYSDLSGLTEFDPFAESSTRAIVVHLESDYRVARMYEQLHGGNIRVFRSIGEARRFLGLEA